MNMATVISFDCAYQTMGLAIVSLGASPALNDWARPLHLECTRICDIATTSLGARTTALGQYLDDLDARMRRASIVPTDVVVEDQTINHVSGGAMHQLMYHYRHLRIHVVGPRAKNSVSCAPSLVYARYRAAYKTRKTANKKHACANARHYVELFAGSDAYERWGVERADESHVADALMQVLAARDRVMDGLRHVTT
jgi:hypothetical protein